MTTTLLKSLTTVEEIKQTIKTDYAGLTWDEIDNLQNRITENILPVYYGDIIGEWQAMPSEYDGRGADELGMPPVDQIAIYRLMELDLSIFYYERVGDAVNELLAEGYFGEICESCHELIAGGNPFSTHCDTCLDAN